MNLKTYLSILGRRKWVLLATLVVTLAVTVAGTRLMKPVYTASAKLHVTTAPRGTLGSLERDLPYSDRLMNTLVELAASGPVRDELTFRFSLEQYPQISAEIIANTELMKLTAEANTPKLVSDLANAFADVMVSKGEDLVNQSNQNAQESLQKQLAQLETELNTARQNYDRIVAQSPNDTAQIRSADQTVQTKRDAYKSTEDQLSQVQMRAAMQTKVLSVVDPATPPTKPSKPDLLLNLALGLFLGLIAGMGLALLFENLDSTFHSLDQIETVTQLSTLATIPTAKVKWPAVIMNGNSPQEEAFARLRAKVLSMTDSRTCPTLLVTSAERGEGKSTVTANLAASIAKSGRNVIVIDCNLHNPSMHQIFSLPNVIGLSDILQQRTEISTDLQISGSQGFRVITSGTPAIRPSDLITKERLQPFIKQLTPHADLILLDSPAFLAATDTVTLATLADGVILVVGQTVAHQDTVQMACRELGDITPKLLGVVANRVSLSSSYYRS